MIISVADDSGQEVVDSFITAHLFKGLDHTGDVQFLVVLLGYLHCHFNVLSVVFH